MSDVCGYTKRIQCTPTKRPFERALLSVKRACMLSCSGSVGELGWRYVVVVVDRTESSSGLDEGQWHESKSWWISPWILHKLLFLTLFLVVDYYKIF